MERFIWSLVESGRDDNTNGREYLKSKWMLDIGLHGNVNIKI